MQFIFWLFLYLSMFCCLFSATAGYAEDTIRVGIFDFPPYFEGEENQVPGGLLVDVLKKIFDRLGKKYTIRSYPTKRLAVNLADGKTDVSVIGKRIENENIKGILYSRFPVITVEIKVYTRKEIALPENKSELAGKTVLTVLGYNYGGLINQIIPDPASTHLQAFKKLQARRADYLLAYDVVGKNILKDGSFPDIQERTVASIDGFFAVSGKFPGAENLLNDIVKTFDELKSEGKMDGLL